MYTQCPDCGIAFRVTAGVLKQAAGKVRCGGCGSAFNALEFLSEKVPAQTASSGVSAALPELTPEVYATDDGLPESISPEQSAALLKTLDELAGSDVRIEDTGVEWRVLDEDDTDDDVAEVFDSSRESNVDELLVESATPVDEILTATIVETSDDELRFDDNTPLPDDFDRADEPSAEAAADDSSAEATESEVADETPEPDISLSEPDEWQDILGEFDAAVDETAALAEASEQEQPEQEQPTDFEALAEVESGDMLDMDDQFALQAEAMGIDLSGMHEMPDEDENDESNVAADDGHYVAPLTEEEQTINMMIDQDLLSLAIEDKDGFASTIVIPEEETESKTGKDRKHAPAEQREFLGLETIIMEGDFVRSALEDEKLAADTDAAADLVGRAKSTFAGYMPAAAQSGDLRYGVVAALFVLVLLLVVQAMHQSREALATFPAFNDAAGPIYRALGKPLQPAWDITGWRFEATKGSTNEGDSELTIYSRIGNKSDTPLPYPLIGISLTDRFEETIGSRILDPADYLPNDLDPRKLVQPGNTFNAVISIQSPSEDATGFKLNVCYRLSAGQLRCAIDDFK